MAEFAPVAAALLALLAGGLLALALGRLARAAHRAEDVGATDAPWSVLVAAAVLAALGALARVALAVAGGPLGTGEAVALFLLEGGAGALAVRYLMAAHKDRFGDTAQGAATTGVILVLTAAASALVLTGADSSTVVAHVLVGVAAGAVAWAFSDAAAYVRAVGVGPSWVPSFAAAAAQAIVAVVFARALALNAALAGGSFGTVRLVHSAGFLLAVLLALPCLTLAARALMEAERRTKAPAPAAATDAAPGTPAETPASGDA